MGSNFTGLTVKWYDESNGYSGSGTDITSDVLAIPLFTDTGSGEVNEANLVLSAKAGKYITTGNIIFVKYCLFCSNIFWVKIASPTEPRIIIPLIKDNEIFGYQGRSLKKSSKVKYITIVLDENQPKIFGLNNVDLNKKVYIVEGPFDSMFIENAIAMVGSDVDYICKEYNLDRKAFI